MFVRMPLMLMRDVRTAVGTDESIREFFQRLGYNLQHKHDAGGKIVVGDGESACRFDDAGTAYHRELARRNIAYYCPAGAASLQSVRAEIERFCICYCASSANETNIFVTRVNEGEVTVWIFQDLPAKLTRSTESIALRIIRYGSHIFDIKKALANHTPLEMSTSNNTMLISHGGFINQRFSNFLKNHLVELVLFILALLFGFSGFLIDSVPLIGATPNQTDPLPAWLRTLAKEIWPAASYAIATLVITLTILYIRTPRRTLRWQGL